MQRNSLIPRPPCLVLIDRLHFGREEFVSRDDVDGKNQERYVPMGVFSKEPTAMEVTAALNKAVKK